MNADRWVHRASPDRLVVQIGDPNAVGLLRSIMFDAAKDLRARKYRVPPWLRPETVVPSDALTDPQFSGKVDGSDEEGHVVPVLLRYEKAAQMLDVSRATVERLTASGDLPVRRFGGCARIPVAAIEQFAAGPEDDTMTSNHQRMAAGYRRSPDGQKRQRQLASESIAAALDAMHDDPAARAAFMQDVRAQLDGGDTGPSDDAA